MKILIALTLDECWCDQVVFHRKELNCSAAAVCSVIIERVAVVGGDWFLQHWTDIRMDWILFALCTLVRLDERWCWWMISNRTKMLFFFFSLCAFRSVINNFSMSNSGFFSSKGNLLFHHFSVLPPTLQFSCHALSPYVFHQFLPFRSLCLHIIVEEMLISNTSNKGVRILK